ncbi:MAG: hypothetical protein VCE12_11780, partial [Candidatus Latescibacterota bacterium]
SSRQRSMAVMVKSLLLMDLVTPNRRVQDKAPARDSVPGLERWAAGVESSSGYRSYEAIRRNTVCRIPPLR